jgi:hypothetical protein
MSRGRAAMFLFVGVLGCQRDRDRTTESVVERAIASQGRESKVTIDRDHASITVDLGGVTKPKGWPAAVPFYPRANRAKLEAAESDVRRLLFTTDDSSKVIADFYAQELARLGWQVEAPEKGIWVARRGVERLELHFTGREKMTRAEIEYRPVGPG